jgi:flagellin
MIDISLTSGMRANLLALQQTASLMATTQQRLATGKEVNSAVDDPARYFAASAEKSRANDLLALKYDMGEAIQTVQAANQGISSIQSLLQQMKGIATSARSAAPADITALQTQYDNLTTQIAQLAADSNYKGTNLLKGDTLKVAFNETNTSSISVVGSDTTAGTFAPATADFSSSAKIDAAIKNVTDAISAFRTLSSTLANGLAVITARQDFTQSMADVLQTGSDNLTNADSNKEGANLLALQTRQSLSTTALSLSSQAAQSVLKLFQ